jgi:hypothetical protein
LANDGKVHKTNLERINEKRIISEIDSLVATVSSFYQFDSHFRKLHIRHIKNLVKHIKILLREPLTVFPNVKLFLCADNERVAVTTINPKDIIWSEDDLDRGKICKKLVYTDMMVSYFLTKSNKSKR